MDAQLLSETGRQVPGQEPAVVDRICSQAAYPGHFLQQVGDIPIEVEVPQVRCLDYGFHGCKGVRAIGASCEKRIHPYGRECTNDAFGPRIVRVQVGAVEVGAEQHLVVEVVVHALHDEIVLPVEVVAAPDPGGELFEQRQRLLPADADELLLADAFFVQPPEAVRLVDAVDLADGGDDPVQRDVAGRILDIGARLLGVGELAPQVGGTKGEGEPVILFVGLVADVAVGLQIPAVAAHDALEDIAGARDVVLEIRGRLARGRAADHPHPGIEGVAAPLLVKDLQA